jgi:phytoene dehydrogenase-like protein
MGLPASRATAFSAVKLYREFMLDGGYYPADGMGVFAGSIMDRFVSSGGKMMLSCEARKILFKDGLAEGVLLDNGSTVTAGHIISGCDLMHTIYDLIGKDRIPKAGLDDIRKLKNTLSTFIVYLAEKKDNGGRLDAGLSEGSNTWVLPSYDVDKLYRNAAARQASNISEYMIHVFPGKRTATVFINCDFKDKKFWASNKKDFASALMDKVAARFPDIGGNFRIADSASPYSLYEYTLNYKGAAYGWEAVPEQFGIPLKSLLPAKNIGMVGHWTTLAAGVSGVAYMGSKVAGETIYQLGYKTMERAL